MQPGPTLYRAEEERRKKGSQGLLGAVGEPLSYAPGIGGLLGNAMLSAQYLTGEKPMDEGVSGLAMLTGLLQGTKVAPIMRNAIKVYHGSPHKFDKADSSKIGTGEGAQAYGHGLYWAENPGVAKQYAANVSRADRSGKTLKSAPEGSVADDVANFLGEDVGEHAASRAEQIFHRGRDIEYVFGDGSVGVLDSYGEFKAFAAPKSNLYEANLRWPDPAREAADPLSAKHFLDWDKPLSGDAAEKAKAALSATGSHVDPKGMTGKQVYFRLSERMRDVPASGDFGNSVKAAEELRKAGIPGITYLDAGSRAAGQGTRNYVTFDDALVELLKRNGGLLGK